MYRRQDDPGEQDRLHPGCDPAGADVLGPGPARHVLAGHPVLRAAGHRLSRHLPHHAGALRGVHLPPRRERGHRPLLSLLGPAGLADIMMVDFRTTFFGVAGRKFNSS